MKHLFSSVSLDRKLVLSFLTSALLAASGIGQTTQTKEQVKQQAEDQLKQMTPEEIDQKLKELGITAEEATRRAQALGINLEEYIARQPVSREAGEAGYADPRLGFQMTPTRKQERLDSLRILKPLIKFARRIDIPGFVGRKGIDSLLQPFGYELFLNPPSTIEPSAGIATPPSYALGAGDEILVTLWGEARLNYRLVVNRDGNLVVPDVGPVAANGLTMQQFREKLLRRMSAVYSGLKGGAPDANTFLDVSLGKLKTVQVFVLGEVVRPGGYAMPSMSTVLNAMYAAGGPTVDGTLRDIRVMRSNDTLPPVDLYAYMIRGDKTKDRYVQDGDIILVRTAGKRVAVLGEVTRPAIYELREEETLGDLLALAGGLRFDAYIDRVHIERIIPFSQRREFQKNLLDFDVRFRSFADFLKSREGLASGDIVTIFKVTDLYQNRVTITGNVQKPGPFELKPGMSIRDLIFAADSLKRGTFAEHGTLFRTLPNLKKEILGFSPLLALLGDDRENLLLMNEDSLVVYPDSQFSPVRIVTVQGAVRRPGTYPRNDNMAVSDLLVLAGGLLEGASMRNLEVSRLDISEFGVYRKIFKISLGQKYWDSDSSGRFLLEDFDVVFVPKDPRWSEHKTVKLSGYVMYPGAYTIRFEGEKLADMFRRAGGFRSGAYLEGSHLIRKFNNAGLVPIDFRNVVTDSLSRDNVVIYDGDSVYVAFSEDVVYVSGEVYVPSPVLYREGAGLSYYIEQAGDFKQEAEASKTVVFLPGGKKWDGGDILPGSTIFVPRKIEKEDKTLQTIASLATVLASLAAITVALIQVKK